MTTSSTTSPPARLAPFASVEATQRALAVAGYIADRPLAVTIFLAVRLGKPLFLEGEPGVGKTEVARVLSHATGGELIRLQCYEGLDLQSAAYEWNYSRQILSIRAHEASDQRAQLADLFSTEFLLERPLLRALRQPRTAPPPVLLIDELDRADEEFEAFLLELLAEYQITIPELGTVRAENPPITVVTSNRTREIHDALKRRCLYQWIDFPDFEKELQIVATRVPHASEHLQRQVVAVVQALREEELFKRPGVAETLDWLNALLALDCETLSDDVLRSTLGVLLKYQDDVQRIDDPSVARLLARGRGDG